MEDKDSIIPGQVMWNGESPGQHHGRVEEVKIGKDNGIIIIEQKDEGQGQEQMVNEQD